jgi:hypothetical protein
VLEHCQGSTNLTLPSCLLADVFAFGVLLAELLAGEPAWAALKTHAQVIAAVLSGKRPTMPALAPTELKVRLIMAFFLTESCSCTAVELDANRSCGGGIPVLSGDGAAMHGV